MIKIKFKNGEIKEFESLSGADLRGANLRGANLRGANLWWADLRGADLRKAYLWETDLENAGLEGADLRGADLRGADLRSANLRGANLGGASLRRADLKGAILWEARGIKSFKGYGHLGVAFVFEDQKWIKIGCMSLKVEEWVRDYVKIGEDENYTEKQINKYGEFIKQINEMSVEELKKHIN